MRFSSLARQNAVLLTLAFVLMELLVFGLCALLILLPLGRRSADDLSGLMVLSAQTWAELPPQTRPAFEEELLGSHALALRLEPPEQARDEWHPPYFYLLEGALSRRIGMQRHLSREQLDSGTWYWVSVPSGGGSLSVGVLATRVDSQPITAVMSALLIGLLLSIGLAIWLARRMTRPLARLEAASALIGQGGQPDLLPETGPHEMVTLIRRFNTMAQQIRELLSARTTLLAGVSHDLRTPLARLRLALEMVKDAPSPSLIERMERDIELMNQLIGHVLDLARGMTPEEPIEIELRAFLKQIAAEFSTPGRPVRVISPEIRLPLPSMALRRALNNLLQNAQRYAPDHLVELIAHASGHDLRICVLDRGPGIAADQIEAMFQPFHRMEPSRSPTTGGFGLGLAIVRELARVNGWHVKLEARSGGGLQACIDINAQPVAR
jgi:two-component system osmolarity sensor histidine kinase EnvZ